MCGLCGVFTHEPGPGEVDGEIRALTSLMERRGPDDEGFFADGHVRLGFRRLSVLDTTPAGHQPMVSPDQRFVLVFNGEVYNFRDLGADLERAGVRLRSTGDSEVVLHALATWGPDALSRFNGMFALAFWDTQRRRLLLARDPLGIKPLSYLDHPKGLVFGSQYDQVIRHPWCSRRIDLDALGLYTRLAYVPSPYGMVEGTHELAAGHCLHLEVGSRPVVHEYAPLPPIPDRYLPASEVPAAVDASIHAAVTRQQVSDVPIGTFLSGGVDSPLVTSYMQADRADPVRCFTVGSDDAEMDESALAADYAHDLGCAHTLAHITATEALALLDDVTAAYSEPFADYSSFPTLMVSELARRDVTVALSGDGSDELFWGYPRFAKVLDHHHWFRFPRAGRVLAYGATKPLPTARRPARGVLFPSIGGWYLDAHSTLRPHDLASLNPALATVPAGFDLYDYPRGTDPTHAAEWMRRNELRGHLEMMLRKVDRASMYHSLEVRVPLLDQEVVNTALQLSPTTCIQGDLGKIPLRNLLGRVLPRSTAETKKKGFTVPMGEWMTGELRPLVEDRLLGPLSVGDGYYDRAALQRLVADHCEGRAVHTRGLWTLLSVQLWADQHLRPLERT